MQKQLLDLQPQELSAIKPVDCLNVNVGVLGHVDSGKTSICRVLTQVASTASLDKSPQSKERGITLDLGFSSFVTRVPQHLQIKVKQNYLQFTLVDCPGHASLLRTIIGGAQIIDLMFLVIDINKGIQTQTSQCIVIAQLFIKKLIIVLNKVDSIQEKQLPTRITALRKIFGKTKFGADVPMIPYSTKQNPQQYCSNLKHILLKQLQVPQRNIQNHKFLMLVDHCFKIKGKGTILTGTVTQGKAKVGDEIQICQIDKKSKIKSIEMFRKPLQYAQKGDRVAMLMTHLEAQNIERGLVCSPHSMQKINKFILDMNKVRFFKRSIKNKAKFHIITGHQTVMGQIRLFYSHTKKLNIDEVYVSINSHQQRPHGIDIQKPEQQIFATVTLQKQIYGQQGHTIIGYKYDIDNNQKECRIAFHGKIQLIVTPQRYVRLYKDKIKKGIVDRIVDNYTIIIKDLFTKQTDINQFVGQNITLQSGQVGRIQGQFGKSGKIRVTFKEALATLQVQGQQCTLGFKKWYK